MEKKVFFLLIILALAVPAFAYDKDKSVNSGNSTFQSTTFETTQKPYQIKNDGTGANSSVMRYGVRQTANPVYEDNDLDGSFGEQESSSVDSDRDGQAGESEARLGTEYVTQDQRITTLNNMGFGSATSNFKAAGQTKRSSVFEDENEEDKGTPQPVASPSPEKASKPASKRSVLVS